MRHPLLLGMVFASLLLGACAGSPRRAPGEAAPVATEHDEVRLYARGGVLLAFEDVVAQAARADAVLVGEVHGHPAGLAFAADLWDALLAQPPARRPALALEFFSRDEQADLDDYLAGLTDEAAFTKATARSRGNYPPGHRRMVEAARAAGVPVLAANAPRRYVTLARQEGYARLGALTPEQRRLFALPRRTPGDDYRRRFDEVMRPMFEDAHAGHGDADLSPEQVQEQIDAFYRSQVLWDATMADTLADALAAGRRPVVLVVGRFHVERGGGTLELLRRVRPQADVLTLVVVEREDGRYRPEDEGLADVVVVVPPPPEAGPATIPSEEPQEPAGPVAGEQPAPAGDAGDAS